MLIFLIMYNIVAVTCILYAVFNYMDVLSWIWVNLKNTVLYIWDFIKGFLK